MNDRHRKIGDKFIRIPRLREFTVPVYLPKRKYFKQLLSSNPLSVSVLGIAALIVVGGVLLMLPFANNEGNITPPLIAFFTSASAVSTTGLTIVTTATYWTLFGQAVICSLIFLGGLGLVTVVMFNLWLIGTRFTLQHRILTREAMAVPHFEGLLRMLRNVVVIDLAITAVGALLLIIPFQNHYEISTALWQALFHSVSAFNTAGFDIVGPDSFIPLRADVLLLGITIMEAILGALSFSVLLEVPKVHRWRRFSLNTKLVLSMTFIVSLLAIVAILINETLLGNTLADFSTMGGAFTSVFNGLSASTTTGFSTIDFSRITTQVLLIITGVMFIGGATGSTAGGIKVNTFAAIVANIYSTIKGKTTTEIFGREIETSQILRAVTVAFVSLTIIIIGMMIIMMSSSDIPFEKVLFEATSAFGTVGLSTGALSEFSTLGKVVVIFLMFAGRVAPLSIIMIIVRYRTPPPYRYPQELVKIG